MIRPSIACTALALSPIIAVAEPGAGDAPIANPATVSELSQIVIIANTPLPGLGLPLEQIPANVQTAGSQDLTRQHAVGVAGYLNANFSGVSVNDSADNPFQLDVNYHGFAASPLLGTPEGLSVYVDGVRVNESFGDTVNWDLIPDAAISNVTLISGSNPVFGLNTLGGALALRTKSGHDDPGTELEASGGSFGRRSVKGQTGGELGGFDYFLAGNYFDETGWRHNSPTRLYQGFGKVGWQNERTDLDLSYTYADTSLYGNGAAPQDMLDFNHEASYTPDFTHNLLNFVNLTGTQFLSDKLLLSGNLYYRRLVTDVINTNVNGSYLDENYSGSPLDCSSPPAGRAQLAYCSPGQNAASRLLQSARGLGLQLTDSHTLGGWANQAILGGDYSDVDDTFVQAYQYGGLSADRTLLYEASPFNGETVLSLVGSNRIYGAYATDTLSPSQLLHLTVSLRYNRSTETLAGYSVDTNVGDAGAGFDQPAPLNGNHTFSRVNPSVGFTVTPTQALTYYAEYNEASRAPTVIELGCANPVAPCGLPDDFASDPDLKQVVARTVEAGVRGGLPGGRLTWSADVFRTVNADDIQFVATATNSGYFANVGDTRRQGIDLAFGGKRGGLSWRVAYSYIQATFESGFAASAPSNSAADAAGNIVVRPGDWMPLIPRHTGRLVLDYQPGRRWDIGGSLLVASGSYLHGNENNANQAGGTNAQGAYVSGSGWIAGYAVVNLQGTWHAGKRADFFANIVNLSDRHYATAGFLTSSAFNAAGSFIANPANWPNLNAVSPAAPLALWTGVRIRLD